MPVYRVEFHDKQIKSVQQTNQTTPHSDTILEEKTGDIIWATIEASSDQEAQEKARRLETELQTRQTKREITGQDGRHKEANPRD
jgi:hypothetical protein